MVSHHVSCDFYIIVGVRQDMVYVMYVVEYSFAICKNRTNTFCVSFN